MLPPGDFGGCEKRGEQYKGRDIKRNQGEPSKTHPTEKCPTSGRIQSSRGKRTDEKRNT